MLTWLRHRRTAPTLSGAQKYASAGIMRRKSTALSAISAYHQKLAAQCLRTSSTMTSFSTVRRWVMGEPEYGIWNVECGSSGEGTCGGAGAPGRPATGAARAEGACGGENR